MELLGESKQEWFAKFLDATNGLPSDDTFGRVFGLLDAEQFQRCFIDWGQTICQVLNGQNAKRLLNAVRDRWHFESRLYWVLDVTSQR
jgi:hypothetical protein